MGPVPISVSQFDRPSRSRSPCSSHEAGHGSLPLRGLTHKRDAVADRAALPMCTRRRARRPLNLRAQLAQSPRRSPCARPGARFAARPVARRHASFRGWQIGSSSGRRGPVQRQSGRLRGRSVAPPLRLKRSWASRGSSARKAGASHRSVASLFRQAGQAAARSRPRSPNSSIPAVSEGLHRALAFVTERKPRALARSRLRGDQAGGAARDRPLPLRLLQAQRRADARRSVPRIVRISINASVVSDSCSATRATPRCACLAADRCSGSRRGYARSPRPRALKRPAPAGAVDVML